MPATIAGALFTAGTFGYAVTYALVTVAINYGLSKLSASLAGRPKRQRGEAGRDVTVRGTVEPMQLIYGQIRTPGFLAYYGVSGDTNKYLHFVIVWAAHQCEEIADYWLDGRHAGVLNKTGGGGAVNDDDFTDAVLGTMCLHAWDHLGTNAQTVDTTLDTATSDWTSTHRGAGLCNTHFRLEYSENVFPDGAPQNFFALVKGRRLYDPRKDSTVAGGSGAHRSNNATTWEYSNNWALTVRDYITGGSRWYDVATPEKRLGFGERDERIDEAYVIAAANISDEDVTIPAPGGSTTTQKRYTCDGQLSCDNTYKDNLEILKSAGVGNVTYVNGKYRIYAGAYDSPVVEIGEDDVLGAVDVVTHPRGESVYNMVSGTFFDESRDWQPSTFPNITNSSYETDDGGQKVRNIELPATRTSYRAQRIAILHLAQSRQKMTVRFSVLSPKAMRIAQWETFYVTLPEFGWNQKVFRCLEWEWDPKSGFPAITAREESSAAYIDPSAETYAEPHESTVTTPEYDEPDTPLSLTATQSIDGVLLRWTVPSPRAARTRYAVYRHTASTPFSSAVRIWEGDSLWLHDRVDTTGAYYYWVVGELNGMQSSAYPVGAGVEGRIAELGMWVARGNCVVRGEIAQKIGGSSAHDSDVYSRASYGSCFIVFKNSTTNKEFCAGLNSDPTTNQGVDSLDYAWTLSDGGNAWFREANGATLILHSTYTTSDEFAVTYDGTDVRYLKNREVVRTVADPGRIFFGDSSFYSPGATALGLRFGPGTNLDLIALPETDPELPFLFRPIPDGEFVSATDQRFWYWGSTSGVSISLTGGVIGGLLQFVADGTTKEVFSRRTPPFRVITTQQFKVYVRWRRTTALTHSSGAAASFGVVSTTYDGQMPPNLTSGSGQVYVDGSTMDAVPVSQWQEMSFTATVTNLGKTNTQLPYIVFDVFIASNLLSGTVQVDAVVAVPI